MGAAKIVPEGHIVYTRDFGGWVARIAIKEGDLPPGSDGFIVSDDQTSPVWTVLVKSGNTFTRTGVETGLPQYVQDKIDEHVQKTIGIPPKPTAYLFATAQAELLLQGRVPKEVAEYRLTVCTGITKDGKKVATVCPNYVNENGRRGSGHCKGCGCPEWSLSEMDRSGFMDKLAPGKAWYPMGCPKGRFSSQPGRRANARA